MPKRDFAQHALKIVEQAIGEKMDGKPLPPVACNEDQETIRGRKGGLIGGKARKEALSAAERKRIAKAAASARWSKKRKS